MSAFSDSLELKIAQWVTGTSMTPPAGTFVALFSASPTDANVTTNELTSTLTGSPNRTAITLTAAQASGETTLKNGSQVVITSSASAGATASHMGIFDAISGGNLLFHGELNGGTPKVVSAGDEVRFNANQLTITIS